jgi:hypothetical protein
MVTGSSAIRMSLQLADAGSDAESANAKNTPTGPQRPILARVENRFALNTASMRFSPSFYFIP